MELSFGIRTWLSLLLTVIGFVSTVFSALYNPWLILPAIAMFILAVILLVYDAHVHGRERADFKKNIVHEFWVMAGDLIGIPTGETRCVSCSEW
jgi:membrane protein YdbS with pleckstrin-like domain